MTFDALSKFITERMKMSHVYQPVMLMELLRSGGQCSEEQIARALLAQDLSQVDYYKLITQRMVGRVLRGHGIVHREQQTKTWHMLNAEHLSDDEREVLIARCQQKLDQFLARRGDAPWTHRKKSSGYISGTLRYEVLKAARSRCELCGISHAEKALEVDHIVPRSKGGEDDLSNLQALCYSCNAMKRDRDDTDFRSVVASYDVREQGCVFCATEDVTIVGERKLAKAIRDRFPVTEGHVLVFPRRHVRSLFDLGRPEINACMELLTEVRNHTSKSDASVSGFNIGVNDGESAGQTVMHCHWHLIPRRDGDAERPRGGVRNVMPGRGPY